MLNVGPRVSLLLGHGRPDVTRGYPATILKDGTHGKW